MGNVMAVPVPAGADSNGQPDPALRQALDAIRARDDFIAIAAHELRSPMNALALQIAAIERMAQRGTDTQLTAEIQRVGRTVERYVRRATVLLDVARINADQLQLGSSLVRARDVIDRVIEAYADEAAFRGVPLTAEIEGDPAGRWDPHMVEEILANLVGNAIKYGEGSPVAVRARAVPDAVVFEVCDGGPGIDEVQRGRIFEKFERVVSGSPSQGGFGLGLWIVGRMVLAHGGAIDVGRGAAGGAVFTVTLPLDPPHAGQEGQECR
jgi:two-component system, OmpR family, sensor kinase